MKTYLITGGAGFFGSILKKYLLNKGYRIVSIDLIPDTFKDPNFIAYQGDICDYALMQKLCHQYHFDAIFHCAALLAHVRKDIKKLWHSNVEGTQSISNLASEFDIKKLFSLLAIAFIPKITIHWFRKKNPFILRKFMDVLS